MTAVSRGAHQAADVWEAYLRRGDLVRGGFLSPHWTADGKACLFLAGMPQDAVIIKVDLVTGETLPMFDVAAVRAALLAATGHEPPYRGLPFDDFTTTPEGDVEFEYRGRQWRLDSITGRLEHRGTAPDSFMKSLGWVSTDASIPRAWTRRDYLSVTRAVPEQLSPGGEWFASIRENNIVVRSTRDGREQRLTFDGTSDRFWDVEALRMKELSGRRFTFGAISPWSPDGMTLLAYRRDVTGVFRMPRTYWLKPFEEVEYLSYQKAGAKLDRIEPFFIDVRSGRQTRVLLADVEDRYIQLLGWHTECEALIIIYPRDFKHVEIIAAHRETGVIRALLKENAGTFVKIWHNAIFAGDHGFWRLPGGSGFLWSSTRDGWNHLYRYDMSGRPVGQLTCGTWPVHDVVSIGVDDFIYFTASIDTERPYDVHVCRVPLDGGPVERLTREKGIHSPTFAPSGLAFADTHSAVDRPTRTDLLRADGTRIGTLSEMDISQIEAVGYVPAEEFTVKATDGSTDLWGVLYKPFNFDPSHSYPVIEYIYGGPQTIEAPRFFAAGSRTMRSMDIPWALAQLGYVVVCLDARGTPGRSKAFHDVVYGNWTVGIADHASAIGQLSERHTWVDTSRVGIYGHSWGGAFCTWALILAPDVYHAAVAYAPGYDPWDTILYEPYLGLPSHNRGAYDSADIQKRAGLVKRPLMIVAGTSDYNIFGSAMKMTRALIDAGTEHEFVVIPEAFHHFSGTEEKYFLMKLTGWFDRHVKRR